MRRQGPRLSDRARARCRHSRHHRGVEPSLRGLDQLLRRHERETALRPRSLGRLVARRLATGAAVGRAGACLGLRGGEVAVSVIASETIQSQETSLDCFASLAMTVLAEAATPQI